jgi:hypothetical protein
MRTACKVVLGLAVVLGVMMVARAAEDKEETLKGTVTCAKCDLKMSKGCATVIKVDNTIYWFDKDSHKKYHKPICTEAKEGTVTGVVSTKDGKKYIKVSKVDLK